ncbi:MAG TPA: GNAT family N-acetyltransferase [Acidimicrobiales bacterium]|nr:GNAT family N-acetyltransferase [Acidimicrobiales bacterium]MDP6894522.1 GNAT family N-acetyltransferase [Acidimicrobiales bacterium]HJM37700.1 GNAT family N-acetyltransferase [Acidimicrobiales bacterium]
MPVDTLRSYVEDDLGAVLALNNAAAPAVNELTSSDLEWFAEISHLFLVSESGIGEERQITGFLIGLLGPGVDYESINYKWFTSRYESFLYVDRVVVGESSWSQGNGRRFYEALAASGSDQPVMCAEVNIKPRNDRSLIFHEKFGFIPVGEQDTEGGSKRVQLMEYTI